MPDKVDATRLRSWVEDHVDLFRYIFDGWSDGDYDEKGGLALGRLWAMCQNNRKYLWRSEIPEGMPDVYRQRIDTKEEQDPTHDE